MVGLLNFNQDEINKKYFRVWKRDTMYGYVGSIRYVQKWEFYLDSRDHTILNLEELNEIISFINSLI